MAYAIKDFAKFQHFKDRTPPWVKLYRDILDDPDWFDLPAEAAKILVMLWVIASEDETKQGLLPNDKKLAFRLRITEKALKTIMSQLEHWLIHVDITPISESHQSDIPERETERETETYKEETETEKAAPVNLFDGVSDQVVSDFKVLRSKLKSPITKTSIAGIQREANRAGITLEAALTLCCERNWRGFNADWLKPQAKPGAFSTIHDQRAETIAALTGRSQPENVIEGVCHAA